jgi:amidohydrolase
MMNKWIDKNFSRLIEIRHFLHQHPELGFEEYNTSDYLKNLLQQAGYEIVQNKKMVTGFFCEYGNKKKPTLGIRSDLDALPISDIKNVPYRSKNEGVMHACGHDVHMAIVTGLALWLKEKNIKIEGTVRFIFQPAEEKAPGGALKMIDSGALEGLKNLIGIHVLPRLEASKIGFKSGPISAAVTLLNITMNGPGGHTSRPHETVDLIAVSTQLIQNLHSAIQNINWGDSPYVMAFGQIEAGRTFNVIPSRLILRGSVRYLDVKKKETLRKQIRETINRLGKESGAEIQVRFPYSIPTVYNNSKLSLIIERNAILALGKKNVIKIDKASMGSDDFGFYSSKIPSALIRLGSSEGNVRDLHVANFDVDEECIRTGVKALSKIIIEYFKS